MKGIHVNFQRFAIALMAAACLAGIPALAQTDTAGQPGTADQTGTMTQPGTAAQAGTSAQPDTSATQPDVNQPGTANETGTMNQSGSQSGTTNQSGMANQSGTMNQPGMVNQGGTMNQSGALNSQVGTFRHEHMRSRSAEIRHIQRQLKADGFYHGRIDGIAGPQFHSALRRFQRDEALPVTGRLNQQTLRHLGATHRMGEAARRSEGYASRTCHCTASRVGHYGRHGAANRSWNSRHQGSSANRYGNFGNSANRYGNSGMNGMNQEMQPNQGTQPLNQGTQPLQNQGTQPLQNQSNQPAIPQR